MDEPGLLSRGLLIAAVLGAGAMLLMNTCAIDRIERQVIDTREQVEAIDKKLDRIISSRPARGPVAATGSGDCQPGEALDVEAVGWGDRAAAVRCVEGAAAGAPRTLQEKPRPQGDHYVNRRTQPPSSINRYTTNEGDARRIAMQVLDSLMALDHADPSQVVPALAVEWSISDDQLSYTYRLRRGVLFADGRPFTAADVAFSFAVMRDPQVKADHLRAFFEDVEALETPDPHTVVVRYRKRYWAGMYRVGLSLPILNKGWYEEMLPRFAERYGVETFATTPGTPGFGEVFNKTRFPCPGTGPYYFPGDRYEPDAGGVELVQNPFYWGIQVHPERHNMEKHRWIYISDPVAAFEEFRKGTFDVSVVDHAQWEGELKDDPTIERIAEHHVYDHMGLGHSAITWNNREPPFDDARVRRAMVHLIDRAWMLREIERGHGNIAVANSKRIYPTYGDLEPLPYDPEKARALLAEAGWADTDGDGVLDKGGEPFQFELKVGSSRPIYTQTAGLLEDACKKVGIRMTLRTLEWATFVQDFYDRNFDAAMLYHSFSDPFIDNYEYYHSSQDIPNGGNAPGWHNDEADALLEAMRTEFDREKRVEMFHRFNRIFQQEQPRTLLLEAKVGVLINKRFEDVEILPVGLRADRWWVKPENVKYR